MLLTKKQKNTINEMEIKLQYALAERTTSVEILKYIVSLNKYETLNAIPYNENATTSILDSLLEKGYLTVAAKMVAHKNISTEALKKLIPLSFLQNNLNECECNFEGTIAEYCDFDLRKVQNLIHAGIIMSPNVTEDLLIDIINETSNQDILNEIWNCNIATMKIKELVDNKTDWIIELEDRANRLDYAMSSIKLEDYEAAYNIILPEAHNGNPNAQYALSCLYAKGNFVEQDSKKSFYWIKQSAENQFEPAMFLYAMELFEKDTEDIKQAYIYMEAAAVNGYQDAIDFLNLAA